MGCYRLHGGGCVACAVSTCCRGLMAGFAPVSESNLKGIKLGQSKMVAGAFELSGAGEGRFLDEVLKIACGGGAGGTRHADVFLRTKAAGKAFGTFLEHAEKGFFLPFVETPAMQVKEAGFGDEEFHQHLRLRLGREHSLCEINQPGGDLQAAVGQLQLRVVSLAGAVDDLGKGDKHWMAKSIGQCFFSDGAGESAIAVLKRVDGDKIEMSNACPGQNGQRGTTRRRGAGKPR